MPNYKRLCLYILSVLATYSITYGQSGVSQIILQPPNQLQNNQTYSIQARDRIIIKAGVAYKPSSTVKFIAKIDETILLDANYKSNTASTVRHLLNTNLPVGTVDASASVDEFGQANYIIPLLLPPGVNNFSPILNVTYNSSINSGTMGIGWNLNGISTIKRVAANPYFDGEGSYIRFNNTDRFTLNNERLIAINGSYGENGTTYSCEKENNIRIVSYGFSANGPSSFTVRTENGIIMEFGTTVNSKIIAENGDILEWLITKMTDHNGNYIEYIYNNYDGQIAISKINYTGNNIASIEPFNTIHFFYDIKRDKRDLAVSSNIFHDKLLLRKLEVSVENLISRMYQFNYAYSNGSKLIEVVENNMFDNRYNSTIVNWGENSISLVPADTKDGTNRIRNSIGQPLKLLATGDLDNDGIKDILFYDPTQNHGNAPLVAHVSSKNPSITLNDIRLPTILNLPTIPSATLYDSNNDGKDEIYVPVISGNNFIIMGYEYANNVFTTITNPITQAIIQRDMNHVIVSGINLLEKLDIIPVNLVKNSNTTCAAFVTTYGNKTNDDFVQNVKRVLNSSTNSNINHFNLHTTNHISERIYFLDLNGDNVTDIFEIRNDSSSNKNTVLIHTYKPSGSFAGFNATWSASMNIGDINKLQFGDYNGDGNFDLLTYIGNSWQIYKGLGLSLNTNTFDVIALNSISDYDPKYVEFTDLNSDGFYDLVYIKKVNYQINGITFTNGGVSINALYSDGNNWNNTNIGITEALRGFCYYPDRYTKSRLTLTNRFDLFAYIDVDNDGNKDMLYLGKGRPKDNSSNCIEYEFQYYLCKIIGGIHADKVTEVVNGYNISTIFNYINNFVYLKNTNYKRTLSYIDNYKVVNKINNVVISMNKKMHNSNSIDETIEFNYQNGVYHTAGKGFLGFEQIAATTVFDNDHKTKTITKNNLSPQYGILYPKEYIKQIYKNSTEGFVTIHNENLDFNFDQSLPHTKMYRLNLSKVAKHDVNTELTHISEYKNYNSMGLQQTEESYYQNGDKKTEIMYTYIATNNCHGPNKIKSINFKITSKNYKSNTSAPIHNKLTIYDYHTNGNLKSITEFADKSDFVKTEYEYHTPGVIFKKTTSSPMLHTKVEKWFYDSKFRFKTQHINVLNQTATYEYEPIYGNITKEVTIEGYETKYEYNRLGRLTKVTDYNGNAIHYSRKWDDNTLNGLHYVNTITNDFTVSKEWYDLKSNLVMKGNTNLENTYVYEKYIYDNKRRVIQVYKPYTESMPTNQRKSIQYEYDKLNRLRKTMDGVRITRNDYTFDFDVPHNSNLLINGKNKVLIRDYTDVENHPIYKLTVFNNDNELESFQDNISSVTYTYHPNGNLLTSEAAGAITSFVYDHRGNKRQMNEPNAGTLTYYYDAYNRLFRQIDARGYKIENEYDIADRVIEQRRINPSNTNTETVTYNYIPTGNGMNQIQTINGVDVIHNYIYDNKGRIANYSENIKGQNFITSFTYDGFNRPLTVTYPSGYCIKNIYESAALKKVVGGNNNKLIWEVNEKNFLDIPIKNTLGNGVQYFLTLDSRYNISEDRYQYKNNSPLYHHKYVFDAYTNNLNIHEDVNSNLKEKFTYDIADRLDKTDFVHVSPSVTVSDINYANNGNISRKTDLSTVDYVYGTSPPHAVVDIPDNALNNLPAFKQNILYNAAQRAHEIQYTDALTNQNRTLSFIYGADDERRRTEYRVNNVLQKTTYFVGNFERHVEPSSTKDYHYIYANGRLVAVMIKTGTTENLHYVCTDYLGNINMLIDETRTITQHNSFDAWGRRRNPADWSYTNITTTTAILNRGFTGHEHLDDFGLINMNARLYDPFIGRMLGPDNYLQDASNSQNYNRYSYVLNNPTRYTDPTGNAYNGGTWSQGAAATFAANYNNHTAEYAAWEQFFNAEKDDMMRELMPQSGGGSSIAEVNMGDGYTPIGDNSSSAFVQNYYAFRAGLIRYRYEHIISGTYLLPEVVIYVKRSAQGSGGGMGTAILDGVQTGLDVVGLIPGVGEIADGVNALIYTGRGDYVNAGLSAAAMIPFAGWAATGGKLTNKAVKYHNRVDAATDLYHTFPRSFDSHIMQNGAWSQRIKDGANWFELPGTINGTNGMYQIGINNSNVIFHRNFVPFK